MSAVDSSWGITDEQVDLILKLLDRSDYEYVSLEIGDLRIAASKNGAGVGSTSTKGRDRSDAQDTPVSSSDGKGKKTAEAEMPPPAESTATWREPPDGQVAVTAPTLGTFYGQPAPGADPFVKPGDRVTAAQTLCLIEVMKMFNSVNAGHDGEVTEVLCRDGEMVEYGQPLFFVRPDVAS